jgi:hypothetical protein
MAAPCGDLNTSATLDCVPYIFNNVVNAALMFVGTVTLILIIWAGIKFIMSGGDNKQLEGARKTLTYAVIGLAIVVFSFLIINIIGYVTGVTCIRGFSFTSCQ